MKNVNRLKHQYLIKPLFASAFQEYYHFLYLWANESIGALEIQSGPVLINCGTVTA